MTLPVTEQAGGDAVDLLAPEFLRSPAAGYRYWRAERPVARMTNGGWLITRHADIHAILADPGFSNAPSRYSTLNARHRSRYSAADLAGNILPFMDPPLHTGLRQSLGRAFRLRLQGFSPELEALAIQHARRARTTGCTELIDAIAGPYAREAMCRFLGLPVEDADELGKLAGSFFYLFAPITDPVQFQAVNTDIDRFRAIIRRELAARRETPRDDLITGLLGDASLTEAEIVDNLLLLYADGVENIRYGMGNVLMCLAEEPERLAMAAISTTAALPLTNEALRLESPAQVIPRIVLREYQLHEVTLAPGSAVFLALGSANRDERVYTAPDEFDPARDRARSLIFGSGRHACLGGALAVTLIATLVSALCREQVMTADRLDEVDWLPRFGHRWPSRVVVDWG